MDLPKDLVAASATPLILSILNRGDSYGYALIQEIRELSGGEMQWADGMLYPILHRLERKKLIKSYWGTSETGRKRKYYKLRREGAEELGKLRESWRDIYGMLRKLEAEYV